MKSSPVLVRVVRTMLGVAGVFYLIGLVLAPIMAFVPAFPLNFTSTTVRFDPAVAGNISQDFHPGMGLIRLDDLNGSMSISDKGGNDALAKLKREVVAPGLFVTSLLGFAVTFLLSRLCRNVERGDVFVEQNLKYLRWLGVAIIGCSLLASIAHNWELNRVAEFVRQHVTFERLTIAPPTRSPDPLARLGEFLISISYTQLITGLLLIALAEVFRQGLALKREAEFTV